MSAFARGSHSDARVFDDPLYGEAFLRFRAMPDRFFDQYLALLDLNVEGPGSVLDVGAGPGLQAEMLLSRLPASWKVQALEPFEPLRTIAQERLKRFSDRILLRACTFLDYTPSVAHDAVWMSETVHLFGDVGNWVPHLKSVLAERGRVLIRTSTHEQLHEREWYRFFPKALEVDLARHPSREAIVNSLRAAEFKNIAVNTVDESRLIPADILLSMFRARAFSTLHALDEISLERGLAGLESSLGDTRDIPWDYVMTAYTATR